MHIYSHTVDAPAISDKIILVSYPVKIRKNVGAYTTPYSGVGVEYAPLGATSNEAAPLLHEVGYQPQNKEWNFPSVLSPFWRACYNLDSGHKILLEGVEYELGPEHILIIPEHQLFHCISHGTARTFWIHFSMPGKAEFKQHAPILLKPEAT